MRGSGISHLPGEGDGLLRVIRSGARDDRHAPIYLSDRNLDYSAMFFTSHRRRFTRRATRHHEVNSLGNLPLYESAKRLLID
jgi:hypothetical protein